MSEWHHVALVVEFPAVRLYIDGQLLPPERTMDAPILSAETGDIKIGRRDPGDEYFKGRLDDVRLYDEALSEEEITGVMMSGFAEGTPENPFLIRTAGEMQAIGEQPQDWDKHFRLVADIDLGE